MSRKPSLICGSHMDENHSCYNKYKLKLQNGILIRQWRILGVIRTMSTPPLEKKKINHPEVGLVTVYYAVTSRVIKGVVKCSVTRRSLPNDCG